MKHIIIGTAGHIDHGKTTLIKALTGRNTDRWKEEQERGITIDLGFTWFDLSGGRRVGIIDVPGHERFVNNMVAGVVGMDLVMLVIAADEGIMPQTREHMNILRLLGIRKSILVLNKCDLVDEDWIELMEEDIRENLKGTIMENAPLVRVSAVTGQGLDELVDTISSMIEEDVEEKDANVLPRLPVDRVFSISGFGTVITGTLISGTISKDDLLELYPIGRTCKVRNIQVHEKNQDSCMAGQRVAINLSNVKKNEIRRGCVLAPVNSLKNTDLLDVRLEVLEDSERIVTNHERLHLYTGTSEILCRTVLLDKEEIGPGESGLVQLRLEEPLAAKRGDRFVVRFYSPMETIGGGVILEPNPKRKKRFNQQAIDELSKKESGSLEDIAAINILAHPDTMITRSELGKLMSSSEEELQEALDTLEADGTILAFRMKKDVFYWHKDSECLVFDKILKAIRNYHEKYPYRYGLKKAEIYTSFMKKVKTNVFDAYIEMLCSSGKLKRTGDYVSTPDYEVVRDEKYLKIENILLGTLEKAGFDFVRFSEIDFGKYKQSEAEDILILLLEQQRVVKINDEMYTLSEYMDQAKEKILAHLKDNELITIAQVRDMFATSRKSAKPILEYMDTQKITKKLGAESERVAY